MTVKSAKTKPCREILVRAAPGDRTRALVQVGHLTFRASLGRSGISAIKREGDGHTPRAGMRILYGFLRGDHLHQLDSRLPFQRIAPDDLWCDAPDHAAYNRPVRAPFAASHEKMRRSDHLYDICLVLDWNISARRRNGGSAIFFHLAKPGYQPTEGCIAVSLQDMKRILAVVDDQTVVRVL